ncbi:hypothetical protein JDV09_01880 [Mycobacterium sp. Y57]|nr:hypothetical protein [Mycolicibacterium xanthum]
MVAALTMAMFAMIAALTYQGTGFFTPLYHIASAIAPGSAMMQSMEGAMAGDSVIFVAGPALLGLLIHLAVGAGYGAVFGAIAHRARLHGGAVVAAALVWGLVVFGASTWIGLPLAAWAFGGGAPIADMAAMVGYPTFIVEHVLYGGVLGGVLAAAPRTRR